MKFKAVACAMMLATASGGAVAKEWTEIKIGVEGGYPPFSWIADNGEVVGFDVDISRALCEAMAANCTIVSQEWDKIIPSLLARKYDAIVAAMDITEERKRRVSFTEPYAKSPNQFVAAKGSSYDISMSGLRDTRIGVQRGTSHDKYVTAKFDASADIVRYGSIEESFVDLAAGRLQLIIADGLVIQDGFLNKPQGVNYGFIGHNLQEPKYFGEGMGIAVRKRDQALRDQFNSALNTIIADGTYKTISMKYFGMDISGR